MVSDSSCYTIEDIFLKDGNVMVKLSDKSADTLKQLLQYRYLPFKGTWADLKKIAADCLVNGMPDLKDELPQQEGLVHLNKIDYLKKKEELILKQNAIKVRVYAMSVLANSKMREMSKWADAATKELSRVNKILWTLELYLGINEDIVMLQDGVDVDGPIHLMQELLYMDEEVGDPTDGGLDIRSIKVFEEWLLRHNTYYGYKNLELIVPHKKCVRIMRVRRNKKDYNDKWENLIMEGVNFKTYILIRNGDRLYKVDADISFGPKLFPDETEIMDVMDKPDTWKSGTGQEQALDLIDIYRRNLLIMQGLVDRTEVFGNLSGMINIIDGSAFNNGDVVLHYESDLSKFISDGSSSFNESLKAGRSQLGVGSRVYYGGIPYDKDHSGRFPNAAWNARRYPSLPDSGIYTIDANVKTSYGSAWGFKYLPSDDIYVGYESKERTRRVMFKVWTNEITNYDYFTHRDIQYLERMLHDRRERKNYAGNMGTLKAIYKLKKKENELELLFVRNIIQKDYPSVDDETIMDLIDWWKKKVKFKRSIQDDSAKAMRMILQKLKK